MDREEVVELIRSTVEIDVMIDDEGDVEISLIVSGQVVSCRYIYRSELLKGLDIDEQ